jgi:hypothetical protein
MGGVIVEFINGYIEISDEDIFKIKKLCESILVLKWRLKGMKNYFLRR